jgi:predicted type IV restriction endonuclease
MIDEIMNAYRKGVEIVKSMGKQAKEAHTENYIISPILEILGWSALEKRCLPRYSIKGHKGTDEVDFALFADGFSNPPIILVEAKPLGTPFSFNIRGQLEYYGTVIKKAKWLIYTDGKEWVVLSNDKKEIVLSFNLEEGIDEKFTYLSFESVQSGKLQKYTFRSMAEKAVEKYLAKFQGKLAEDIYLHYEKTYPKDEIEEAIKRLKTGVTQPFVVPKPEPEKVTEALNYPIEIYANYKGVRYEAKLFEKGMVLLKGKEYTSVSAAAISVVDSKTRNGWTFWRVSETGNIINDIYHAVMKKGGKAYEPPKEIDTIVVPAQEEGFKKTFLGENCWFAIRINQSKIPLLKYIAAYVTLPTSAITHFAEIDRIESYKDTNKFIVYFKGKAKKIEPIRYKERGSAPQSPRYTNIEKLLKAKELGKVF